MESTPLVFEMRPLTLYPLLQYPKIIIAISQNHSLNTTKSLLLHPKTNASFSLRFMAPAPIPGRAMPRDSRNRLLPRRPRETSRRCQACRQPRGGRQVCSERGRFARRPRGSGGIVGSQRQTERCVYGSRGCCSQVSFSLEGVKSG